MPWVTTSFASHNVYYVKSHVVQHVETHQFFKIRLAALIQIKPRPSPVFTGLFYA